MVHSSAPADTDPEVFRRQFDRWRKMTPAERAALADRLSIDVAKIAVAGIRRRHADISDWDLLRELVRRRHGQQLADAAMGHIDPT